MTTEAHGKFGYQSQMARHELVDFVAIVNGGQDVALLSNLP